MIRKTRATDWVTISSYCFLVLLIIAFVRQQWIVAAVPLILAILIFSFYKPRYILFLIVALTPLSINLEEIGRGTVSLYIPTEPLLFGLTILFLLGYLYKRIFPDKILRHPVSIAMIIYMAWILITSITSVDRLISIKFLISRVWYIIPIFYGGATIFLKPKNIRYFIFLYLIPFMGVVVYTTIRHAGYGFESASAHWVMEPFYRDHTQYGAVVAFFIPILVGFVVKSRQNWEIRTLGAVFLFLLLSTLIYTYSRAALLSVFAALGVWVLMKLKINLKLLLAMGFAGCLALFFILDNVMIQLEKNRTDSSDNLVENVESIANITTDASNLERINRWNSVFRMSKVKPIFGFGPGTYMFEYAPYQRSRDLTVISTNFGDVGNAHSEYLGPLAESGFPGLLTVLFLVVCVFYTAFRAYNRLPPGQLRHTLLFTTLALVTYFTHGLLNNFLDSDKASVPVFGAIAIVVAIDILSKDKGGFDEIEREIKLLKF